MKLSVNINNQVLITEWKRGTEAFDQFYANLGLDPAVYRKMCRQPDGRLKMQLWTVMQIYGPATEMGMSPPIDPEIEFVVWYESTI